MTMDGCLPSFLLTLSSLPPTGLIYSMTMDGCLPSFLLTRNEWRGTDHFIILSYLLLAVSQVSKGGREGWRLIYDLGSSLFF